MYNIYFYLYIVVYNIILLIKMNVNLSEIRFVLQINKLMKDKHSFIDETCVLLLMTKLRICIKHEGNLNSHYHWAQILFSFVPINLFMLTLYS